MLRILSTTLLALTIAACHHDKPAATPMPSPTDNTTAAGEPDPTLPSWAPPSCKAYHATVVKLTACTNAAQADRDAATAKYDADAKAWHDMQNAQQADLDRVKGDCDSAQADAQAKLVAGCPAEKTAAN